MWILTVFDLENWKKLEFMTNLDLKNHNYDNFWILTLCFDDFLKLKLINFDVKTKNPNFDCKKTKFRQIWTYPLSFDDFLN